MLGGGGEQCLTVMELFWDRVARDTPMPGGDGAQPMPRVALWGTGCVHCKHGQGQTAALCPGFSPGWTQDLCSASGRDYGIPMLFRCSLKNSPVVWGVW